MRSRTTLADKVRRGESLPLPAAALLSALTPVWRLGMWWRMRRPRVRVNAHVISFGNITVGGTGKTPAVIERARAEVAAGKKVAVLTRGYGTSGQVCPATYRAEGGASSDVAEAFGDEPALIVRKAPEVRIMKGADRVASARAAIEEYGCDTLILDDGFQYVRLARDENVLVIDAAKPFGDGRLMPRGILREPLEAMGRATEIILTRCDQAADLARTVEKVEELCPGAPLRQTRHAPTGLWRVADGEPLPLEHIVGKEVFAACAIGNPEAFFATLEDLGAVVTARCAFTDHRPFTAEDLPQAEAIVVTEKDAVRMGSPAPNVLALVVELRDFHTGA